MELRNHLLPWKLDDDFVEQIESFAIWGNSYDLVPHRNAIFTTKNNQVYAIGDLISRCFKAAKGADGNEENGELKGLNKPVLLEELSNIRIKKFSITFNHVFVCTEDGKVLGYGRYKFKKDSSFNLPQRVCALNGINVVDIAVGLYDNALMLLSSDGKVHHWTLMQKQSYVVEIEASKVFRSRPIGVFTGSKLVHFFVLLDNGQVVKLNRHTEHTMNFPRDVEEEHRKIKKLACGYSHVLLLNEDGRLFVNGFNDSGELGLGVKTPATAAGALVHVASIKEKIVDIAATPSYPVSAAITECGKVYMWGKCRGVLVFEPTLTSFKSLNEVFFHCSVPLFTYQPVKVTELAREPPLAACDPPPAARESVKPSELTNGFSEKNDAVKTTNEPSSLVDKFYDFTIVVEGKKIPVHKGILKLRSQHFAEMFRKGASTEKQSILEIAEGDLKSYEIFVKFLYTDSVDESLPCHQIIELLALANKYRVESLAEHCSSKIQSGINIDNVIALYKSTVSQNDEDPKMMKIREKLREFCVLFTVKNEVAVVRSKEFANLSPDLAKDLIMDVCRRRSL